MRRPPSLKLSLAVVASAVVGLLAAGGSLAAPKLGNGPPRPPQNPKRYSLSATQPLILVGFQNGKVTSVTGTAVPKSLRQTGVSSGPQFKTAKCGVNFTHTKQPAGTQTAVAWYGGIGCGRSLVLFGQAYLQRTAASSVAAGNHYQGYMRSAASGSGHSVVNGSNPSLYIRHLVNVAYLSPGGSGNLGVYPGPGQQVNGATVCVVSIPKGYGIGVHCDVYSNRF